MGEETRKRFPTRMEETEDGYKVTYPENHELNDDQLSRLGSVARLIEEVTDRRAHGVFLNVDKRNPKRLYGVNILLDVNG